MDSSNKPKLASPLPKPTGRWLLAALVLAPTFFMAGCMMTPEDKAFYGRGWINPDELDEEQPPPRSFTDPTAIQPHMMGPGEY